MAKKSERTRYFIHPSSQLKYMALSILPALIMSLSSIYLLIDSGGLVLNRGKVVIFAGLFGVLVCTALLSLSYSHRIVGPLFRIRRCIDMLPIQVRKHDEFRDLAESLGNLKRNLKDRDLLESK